MITNHQYQKTVDKLRERMQAIERSYRTAYFYSFAGGLILLSWELLYYFLFLTVMSGVWAREKLGEGEFSDMWHVFLPNVILLTAPLLCAVLGYFGFKRKMRTVKLILFFLSIAFAVSFIILLGMGFDAVSFVSALIYDLGLIALTAVCFTRDRDDAALSKIDGYPRFDPLLMNDIEPDVEMREKLRFEDKGEQSSLQLIDERDREYLENNPYSETAQMKQRELEEKREQDIGNWLDEISGGGSG